MKTFITIFLTFLSLSSYSQNLRYIMTTTSQSYINYNLRHNGILSIGANPLDPTLDSSKLQLFNDGPSAISVYNNFGRLQIGVANADGNYFSASKQGDAIFRVLGTTHGLNFVMPNDDNNGLSKIRFADEFNHNSLLVFNNGKVTIGSEHFDSENYNLYVINGIKTEKIKVEIASTNGWADYVFYNDYQLMPLTKLEEFVKVNNHLPEIPSAEQVVNEGGIELKDMTVKLLKKVEELTLYIIEQDKKIKALEELVNSSNKE